MEGGVISARAHWHYTIALLLEMLQNVFNERKEEYNYDEESIKNQQ